MWEIPEISICRECVSAGCMVAYLVRRMEALQSELSRVLRSSTAIKKQTIKLSLQEAAEAYRAMRR
jgi:hypothetical protein